jgi:hypothetical protein
MNPEGLPERLAEKIDFDGDCWMWIAATTSEGYGTVRLSNPRRMRDAHRVVYESLIGPVPVGLELDHLCRVRHCVNPDHLEPVTHQENVRRGRSPAAAHMTKTHCPQGHPYDETNTYRPPGTNQRTCRQCRNAASQRYKQRKVNDG